MFTPQVDLFAIEHTNRDSSNPALAGGVQPGNERFNIPLADVPAGAMLTPPDSYGFISGMLPTGRSRGIGTLPGGVPIYRIDPVTGKHVLIGGIGVFFPGTTGFASEENSALSALHDPTKPDLSLEAELIALAAVGGSKDLSSSSRPAGSFVIGPLGGVALPTLPNGQPAFDIPGDPSRITLVGITLDIFGPGGRSGPDVLADLATALHLGSGDPLSGVNEPVVMGGTACPASASVAMQGNCLMAGTHVPFGWLVTPHAGGGLTADDVTRIINQGVTEASVVRAAIRLPLDSTVRMVFAVADPAGNVLGLYRMPDATVFSIDVAVAKARNVAYYANPALLQPVDQAPGVPPGVAFTNRTFRFLAEPFFPEGIDGRPPAPFSILNDGGTDPNTGLSVGPPLPPSAFTSVMGHDAFNPGTNFRDPLNPSLQNGIVFFPGSTPLYKGGLLAGGLGVSGDGVDQDDVETAFASDGFQPAQNGVERADQVFVGGVRLPFIEFNRNPIEPPPQ
jgi:uncharacterized protein GlcG (DUF336 family)